MIIDRRSFLVGGGVLISTGFLRQARSSIAKTGRPFLLPVGAARETLYVTHYDENYHLTLWEPGVEEPPCFAPDPPRWLEFFQASGHDLKAPGVLRSLAADWELDARQLAEPMHDYAWEQAWSTTFSPAARAYHLLETLDLGEGKPVRTGGELLFNESQYPGSNDRWVEAEDPLTLSLIQARFRELRLPIHVQLAGSV